MKYLQKLDIHDLFRRFNTMQLMYNINLTKMYLYSSIVPLTKRLHACKKSNAEKSQFYVKERFYLLSIWASFTWFVYRYVLFLSVVLN